MPREFYDEKTRAVIISTVAAARKVGKKWAEAHIVARGAGFLGGVPALQIFVKKFGGVKMLRRRRGIVPAPVSQVSSQNDIEAAIERIVQERVRAVIQRAIDVLRSAL